MPFNPAGTIKLIAQIAGVAHELGDYAGPIVNGLIHMREKGPATADGGEMTPAHVQAAIEAALAKAQAIGVTAQQELDALAPTRGTKLDA